MSKEPIANIEKHFVDLPDPRTGNATQHIFLANWLTTSCNTTERTSPWPATEGRLWRPAQPIILILF